MLLKWYAQYAGKFGKFKSGHRTGKGHFHSNPKESQCQRIFKLPYSCTHFTYQQVYDQNPSNQASAVQEPRTSRCIMYLEKAEEPEIKLETSVRSQKKQGNSNNKSTSASLTNEELSFQAVVLEKTLESLLDCKEIKPVNTYGYSLEGLMLKFQYFGHPR